LTLDRLVLYKKHFLSAAEVSVAHYSCTDV